MKRLTAAIALASLCACDVTAVSREPIAPADKQAILDLVAAAQTKADAYSEAREKGLKRAWEALEPSSSWAPCGEKLPKLPQLADEGVALSKADEEAFDVSRWRMNVVPAWAVLGGAPPEPLKPMQEIEAKFAKKGPRRDQYERQSSMLLRLVNEGKYTDVLKRDDSLKIGRELSSDEYWGWELNVVAAIEKRPLSDASDKFEAGLIVGKAFLWSFKEGRVVCAAKVIASNQDKITLTVNPKDTRKQEYHRLGVDLKNEAFRAAIEGLKAVPEGADAKPAPKGP